MELEPVRPVPVLEKILRTFAMRFEEQMIEIEAEDWGIRGWGGDPFGVWVGYKLG